MKKVYFIADQTLYAKVLLPLIIKLANQDVTIVVKANRSKFYKYSPRKYAFKPTGNDCINVSSLEYVAELIDLKDEFKEVKHKIIFKRFIFPKQCDFVIGTTKNLPFLKKYLKKTENIYATGYQHIPTLLSFSRNLKNKSNNNECENIFLGDNEFTNYHGFKNIIKAEDVKDYDFVNFLNLDTVYKKYYTKNNTKKYVLIFHPGGYRKVLTKIGASKEESYRQQKNFIVKTCMPVLNAGFTPVIKVHPLYAKYHSYKDLKCIISELTTNDKIYERTIITEELYWKYAYNSMLIVTFGSSSVYELFAAGISNVVICNFLGKDRSEKFTMFDSLFVDNQEDYNNILLGNENLLLDNTSLSRVIFNAYSSLFTGDSLQRTINSIFQ